MSVYEGSNVQVDGYFSMVVNFLDLSSKKRTVLMFPRTYVYQMKLKLKLFWTQRVRVHVFC